MPSLMVLGTASSVGKSLVTLGLCRWLHRQGKSVAPFKAINVSFHPYRTSEGIEINVSQAYQALACGLAPTANMNPITYEQYNCFYRVLDKGKPRHDVEALPTSMRSIALRASIQESYSAIASGHELVVLEGCGSPVELNLRGRDIANLWLAGIASARCILVADIERCGVFASIIGTWTLMEESERGLFDGFVINKFQGCLDEFNDGVRTLEEKTGIPCLGVIPLLEDLRFKAEDSMDFQFQPFVENIEHQLDEIDRWTEHMMYNFDKNYMNRYL